MKNFIFTLYPLLFAKKSFEKLNRFFILLGMRGLGMLNHKTDRISGEGYFLSKMVREYNLSNIFDIGANIGDYANTCRNIGFKGPVFSFEPHPITFKTLERNTTNKDITAYNIGFSENVGELTIYDYSKSDGSEHASLYKEVLTELHKEEVTEHVVAIDTIDNFIEKKSIQKIGLLKIDTEGNELPILKGAKNALSSKKIDVIHFEFNEMNVISRAYFRDFYSLLNQDFNLYRLLPSSFLRIQQYETLFNEFFAYQNIIAIRKDLDKES
ncbi:MAG: FkbM family methyltransferase [Bacteroidota bacterium]